VPKQIKPVTAPTAPTTTVPPTDAPIEHHLEEPIIQSEDQKPAESEKRMNTRARLQVPIQPPLRFRDTKVIEKSKKAFKKDLDKKRAKTLPKVKQLTKLGKRSAATELKAQETLSDQSSERDVIHGFTNV
jgi:hypothetical protein